MSAIALKKLYRFMGEGVFYHHNEFNDVYQKLSDEEEDAFFRLLEHHMYSAVLHTIETPKILSRREYVRTVILPEVKRRRGEE